MLQGRFKALVITGMTGTGKTSLAMKVTERLGGELVCGDNTQMYQGLPTLTNKVRFTDCAFNTHMYDKYSFDEQVSP